MSKIVCDQCGSANVEILMWVNPNTHEIGDDSIEEREGNWCKECEENVELVPEEEYEPDIEEL